MLLLGLSGKASLKRWCFNPHMNADQELLSGRKHLTRQKTSKVKTLWWEIAWHVLGLERKLRGRSGKSGSRNALETMLVFAFRYNWFLVRSHETILWYLYFRKALLAFLWAVGRVAMVEVER